MGETWLGELMRFVARLFPRLLILEATHGGVAFVRGKHIKCLEPGLHIYWPLWTEVVTAPVVRQTVNLPPQALTTQDARRVVVGGMVRFRIRNTKKALAESWDIDRAIVDESLVVLCDYITTTPYDSIQQSRSEVNQCLTRRIAQKLTEYGVTVLLAHLTDFSTCETLNHVGALPVTHSEQESSD